MKCDEKTQSNKDLTSHITASHPNFKFPCSYCQKTYDSFNGKYKHERSHAPKVHQCEYCGKAFQFPQLLLYHRHLHTGKDFIPCTNCPKKFLSQCSMDQYVVTHRNVTISCDKCSFTSKTRSYLKQHKRGKHSPGWKAACGKKFDWPKKLSYHNIAKNVQHWKDRNRKLLLTFANKLSHYLKDNTVFPFFM